MVQDYHAAARPKAVIDYAFHLIITDPTADIMGQELPALIQDGYTSFKVYMTYDLLQLDDGQMLDILAVARREGALVMVHAENYDMIKWLTGRLLERGLAEPRWHAVSHARLAEGEATNRAVTLSQLLDVPILLVHVSAAEAIEVIRNAQTRGLKIYGETCPQYLFLTADDIAKPGLEGAKFCCSPPPRDAAAQQAVWQGLQKRHLPGVFLGSRALSLRRLRQAAAWRQDHLQGHRQRPARHRTAPAAAVFRGCRPGPARPQPVRRADRDQPRQALWALSRKGTIAVGSDADIAIWDPARETTVTAGMLHDNVGYTPYEGRHLHGWPVTVLSRGRTIVDNGALAAQRGSGNFLPCALSTFAKPAGAPIPELAHAADHGAALV